MSELISQADQQAEQEVLGALMNDNSLIGECSLNADDFVFSDHADVFRVINDLISQNESANIATVMDRLRGKQDRAMKLAADIVRANLGHPRMFPHCHEIIKKASKKRKALSILKVTEHLLVEDNNFDAIDSAIKSLMAIEVSKSAHSHTLNDGIKRTLGELEELFEGRGPKPIPSGFTDIDETTGGFHKTDLVVIGARPAMGKTALLLNLLNAARNQPIGLISAEQDIVQVTKRLLAMNGQIDNRKLRTARFEDDDWSRLTAAVSLMKDNEVYINDKPGINIAEVLRQAREWKFKYNIQALYVDYIQKIYGTYRDKNKVEQVSEVANTLKNLAKELEIPVVALAQVKRSVEERANKRPMMGDLSDASEIEKEADEIWTLYRDEVYCPDTQDKGIAEIVICKSRHDSTGTIRTAFVGKHLKFLNLTREHYQLRGV